jgi:hypothetical protein
LQRVFVVEKKIVVKGIKLQKINKQYEIYNQNLRFVSCQQKIEPSDVIKRRTKKNGVQKRQ